MQNEYKIFKVNEIVAKSLGMVSKYITGLIVNETYEEYVILTKKGRELTIPKKAVEEYTISEDQTTLF